VSPRAARAIVELLLRQVRSGTLVLVDGASRRTYGTGAPVASVTVNSPEVWPLLLRGSGGLADAYAAGLWDSPDLVAVIRLAARNAARVDRLRARLAPALRPYRRARALLRPSGRAQRRRDIAAHYDLGEQLFSRMLDPTMTYSCAVFEDPHATLEQAQLAKLELVCQKLELNERDRVLEIGGGWGSFAIHAARTRGCHVTTTTISEDQYAYALERVKREGLGGHVKVLYHDYSDLYGRYDKLVSIEMIEAVGWRGTARFLGRCSRLLERHGAMLLQAITIDDRLYELEKSSRSFIKQRIFPGGSLPSVASLASELAHCSDLHIVGLQDLTAHYARTLRCWRERFEANAPDLERFGYDERFRRSWDLYLAYCEAGFAERRIRDVQLLLAKPGCELRALAAGLGSGRRGRRGVRDRASNEPVACPRERVAHAPERAVGSRAPERAVGSRAPERTVGAW
jgi:cyclopropane-fatty-acyl-phospholipid synthase